MEDEKLDTQKSYLGKIRYAHLGTPCKIENFLMLRSGQLVPMLAYASASLILGFVAAALGYRCFFN